MTHPLYEIVDFLYRTTTDWMPEGVRENLATPAILGGAGTFAVFRGIHVLSEKYMSGWFNDKVLPWINKAIGAGVIAIPIAYAIFNPEGALDAAKNHPKYAAGVGGCVVGGLCAAFENDRVTKKREMKTLENNFEKLRKITAE